MGREPCVNAKMMVWLSRVVGDACAKLGIPGDGGEVA